MTDTMTDENVRPDIWMTLKHAERRGVKVCIRDQIGTVSRGWITNLTDTRYEIRDETGAVFGPINKLTDAWFEGHR